jgi:alpha,alpha-trehalose phosphorylase
VSTVDPQLEERHGASHVAPPAVDPLDRTRFPVDEWRLVETRFDASDIGTTESVFSVGNGYLGLRGNYEESRDFSANGTFVNGFHETWPIQHAEEAFGFAKVGQTIVNAPDPKVIRVYVDDEPLELSTADLVEYERSIDFRTGVLERHVVWRTPSGKRVQVDSTRTVSFAQRHLAVITYEVTMLDEAASLIISSQVINRQDADRGASVEMARAAAEFDPRKAERFEHRVLQPENAGTGDLADGRMALRYKCANSGMTIAVAVDHHLESADTVHAESEHTDDLLRQMYLVEAKPGHTVRLTKTVAVHTARVVPTGELLDRCNRTLDRVAREGLPALLDEQREWLGDFWARSDVEIVGQPALQQAVRWNIFQLAQASARADGLGVPAKGVTGSGYGGHYFWDTEIYVMPFLTFTNPWAARNALRFRHGLLDSARHRARQLAQQGALYAWRTINGEEASAYYAAGTAQYHIDADIAYALSQYVGATGDYEFLDRTAVDILVETARLWADLGFWRDEGGGTFHIHGVTGPDEYTTVVNDNLYTNVMARYNLHRAAEAVRFIRDNRPQNFREMADRVRLQDGEVDEWQRAADGMFIPYDEHLGIHPQDAHFLEREMWDLGGTPVANRPLLLHYHPLVIYRFQVLKQTDVVLALFLRGDDFTLEQKRADFDYYDPITTGDSTLSAVVQSIMAAEVGYHDLALRYFHGALFVDLADRHGNTSDGVHVASTGGVWNALVSGFGGFRDLDRGQWHLDPRLPDGWEALTFRLTLRGTRVKVSVTQDRLGLEVEDGDATLGFEVRGELVTVGPDAPVTVTLDGQGPRLEGEPPNPAGTRRADGTAITATVPSGD